MISLYQSFSTLKYSYYHIPIYIEDLFNKDGHIECRKFIRNHFDSGSKLEALTFNFYEIYGDGENCDSFRHTHMVALYLLGLSLQSIFDPLIKDSLSKRIDDISWYDFKYTWFLTCLYHDTASFEEKSIPEAASFKQKQLSYWLKAEEIVYTPYNHEAIKLNAQLTRFSENVVENYFNYRADCKEKDHGILGGYLLFDRLKKNFLRKTEGKFTLSNPVYKDEKGLHWRKEHLDHFAHIADSIVCHNMWTVSGNNKEDVRLYQKYKLAPLVIKNTCDRLNILTWPLHFVLCLLDTIEPTKRFRNLSANETLSNISIKYKYRRMEIRFNQLIREQSQFFGWLDAIKNMENWLDVTVSPCMHEGDECYIMVDIG